MLCSTGRNAHVVNDQHMTPPYYATGDTPHVGECRFIVNFTL
jgi:hypothetical protein